MGETLKTTGFPFDSVAANREYNADVWREYFMRTVLDGVIPGLNNELKVTQSATPAKNVKVSTGSLYIQGAAYQVDPFKTIAIADNASGQARIDRIVVRLDYSNQLVEIDVIAGTPAGSPVAPALTQDASMWELSLARIILFNGFTTIVNGSIADERVFSKTVGQASFEDRNDLNQYDRDVTVVDSSGNPTAIEYNLTGTSTLAMKRVHSNPDGDGRYQTTAELFYLADGTTVYRTDTYTRTFLGNGLVDTQTRTEVFA